MTNDEAITLGKIISTADGGCIVCVESLAAELTNAFPAFKWEVIDNEDELKVVVSRSHSTP